eukprot:ANDGO_01128.mRNA.1 hypothetical protein
MTSVFGGDFQEKWRSLPFHSCAHGSSTFAEYAWGSLLISVSSCVFWFVLHYAVEVFGPKIFPAFVTRKLSPQDVRTAGVKFVSLIHSIVGTVGAFTCIALISGTRVGWDSLGNQFLTLRDFIMNPGVGEVVCACSEGRCTMALSITAGYMFYDFITSYQTYGLLGWPTLLLHHVNIFVCFGLGLWGRIGHWVMAAFMTNEVSTPFLHFSWLFIKLRYKGVFAMVNALLLIVAFQGSRFVWNAFVVWRTWSALTVFPSQLGWILSIAMVIHAGVNFYWCGLFFKSVLMQFGVLKDPSRSGKSGKSGKSASTDATHANHKKRE